MYPRSSRAPADCQYYHSCCTTGFAVIRCLSCLASRAFRFCVFHLRRPRWILIWYPKKTGGLGHWASSRGCAGVDSGGCPPKQILVSTSVARHGHANAWLLATPVRPSRPLKHPCHAMPCHAIPCCSLIVRLDIPASPTHPHASFDLPNGTAYPWEFGASPAT